VSGSVVLFVLVVIAILFIAAISKRGGLGTDVYARQDQLFSAAELRFLTILDQAIAPGQRVLGKVRVADIVSVRSGLSRKTRQIAVNRVAQKHVDFVVCSGPLLVPVCAIELNDGSHNSSAVKRRDEFLSSVCTQVGLPLLVIKAARSYSVDAIRQQLTTAT
jgi:hypothetical protein